MPFSIKQKWIWIAIPKNASSTINTILKEHLEEGIPKHEPIHTIKERLLGIGENYDSYFRFAFVRNPYDRVVSQYFYTKQQRGYEDSFDQWVAEKYGSTCTEMSQVEFLSDETGLCMDFLCRYEKLISDLKFICLILDIPYKNYHLRKTEHGHYRDYYSPESKRIIDDWYKEDLIAFNYSF
jgi:hypothetical protein